LSVIYVGDKGVGKTHLALELTNPSHEYVKVLSPEYKDLKPLLWDNEKNEIKATDSQKSTHSKQIEIQVKLPFPKQILVDWIDTPGEIWRPDWQQNNELAWKQFLNIAKESTGIIVVLSPHREMITLGQEADMFLTPKQWSIRFERWVEFLTTNCPNLKHLLFCVNKADLFCDYQKESAKLKYIPRRSQMTWHERNSYISQKYFRVIQPYLEQINERSYGLSVRCFITTIHDRSLLELPWLYLGSFLD
jgi:hypothetical protein